MRLGVVYGIEHAGGHLHVSALACLAALRRPVCSRSSSMVPVEEEYFPFALELDLIV